MSATSGPSGSPSKAAVHSSPRSSIDAQATNGSPFLQTLQQRFRKSSNASSISSDPPVPVGPEPRSRVEAAKSAKRFLLSVVRDDWDYPCAETTSQVDTTSREPVTYRRREDGLSDIESDSSPRKRRARADPYKFESPEAVANVVIERRRKRRRLFEEEMQWNQGLRTWAEQRDVWTGAVKNKPARRSTNHQTSGLPSKLHERNTSNSTDGSNTGGLCTSSPTEELSPGTTSSVESVEDSEATRGLWLPIFPSLLSDKQYPRARITPASYPLIYSKVVVQSLSPNVPIPLTEMVNALVDGWQAEGLWPPQPAPIAAQDVKTGKSSSAFMRWRKDRDDPTAAKNRVRKSIGAMRRAFGVPSETAAVEDLGIEFREQDTEEMEGNVTLNKGLLED